MLKVEIIGYVNDEGLLNILRQEEPDTLWIRIRDSGNRLQCRVDTYNSIGERMRLIEEPSMIHLSWRDIDPQTANGIAKAGGNRMTSGMIYNDLQLRLNAYRSLSDDLNAVQKFTTPPIPVICRECRKRFDYTIMSWDDVEKAIEGGKGSDEYAIYALCSACQGPEEDGEENE